MPVVIFDDGSLTRSGLERVARYACDVDLLGGVRGAALAKLLLGLGVPVREPGFPGAGIGAAAELAASRGAVLVSGAPLDPQEWTAAVTEAAAGTGRHGLVVHVPDPGHTGSVRVSALTAPAASWVEPVGAAFGTVVMLHAETAVRTAVPAAAVEELLETPGTDHLLICAAEPHPEPEPEPPPRPAHAVTAADTVLAVLTDTALNITNRTSVTVRARVRLGAAGNGTEDLGDVEAELAPRETGSYTLAESSFLAGLEPPRGVVRHWSHETETVYDGGTIRINGLDLRFLDGDGATIAVGSYGSRQGLHVGVNAPELGKVLGTNLTSVAGEYQRIAARRSAALGDLLDQLAEPAQQPRLAPVSHPE